MNLSFSAEECECELKFHNRCNSFIPRMRERDPKMDCRIQLQLEMDSRGRTCLPLKLRVRLHNEVRQLREQKFSYNYIIKRIHTVYGVRLYKSHIGSWVLGLHQPLGRVNKFDAKPSTSLAYVIGVKASDGYLNRHGSHYDFVLRVTDREFAAETGQNLAKLLGRKEPYRPRWDKSHLYWRVTCGSILLYELLGQPLGSLKSYIEHCVNCVAAFLRAFFDGEGGIEGRSLKVHNTNEELLVYVQGLLHRYFGIEATGPHNSEKAGHHFRDPRTGKMYKTKKQCYYLYVPVQDLPDFHCYIGFTIKRKQLGLVKASQK